MHLGDGFTGTRFRSWRCRSVELVRGGASDLYGSSAIGGVIDVMPVVPQTRSVALDLAGATEDTMSLNGLVTEAMGRWAGLAAVTVFDTNGYILTAPAFRGAVDTPYGRALGEWAGGAPEIGGQDGSAFLRGNLLNEARGNGTPVQTNGTRHLAVPGGCATGRRARWGGSLCGRMGLDRSGIGRASRALRRTERRSSLTRLQRSPSQQVGGAAQWARGVGAFTFVAGRGCARYARNG